MTYKIISTRQVRETLFTTVEYNFAGKISTVEIAHFRPSSNEEVDTNIINRAASELEILQAEDLIIGFMPSIEINQEKSI